MWQIGASLWLHLPEFLSAKAARALSQQGGALNQQEPIPARVFCCVNPWQHHSCIFSRWLSPLPGCSSGETCFTKPAPTCVKPRFYSAAGISASIPASPAAASPWHSPRRTGTPLRLCRDCDGAGQLSLPSLCPAFHLLPGINLALFPLGDPRWISTHQRPQGLQGQPGCWVLGTAPTAWARGAPTQPQRENVKKQKTKPKLNSLRILRG